MDSVDMSRLTAGREPYAAAGWLWARPDLPSWPGLDLARQAAEYWRDAWQRSILFCDVLRRRGNDHFEHIAAHGPNVLSFAFELVMDGRQLARPVNYCLTRIIPPDGVTVDARKRPFIVFDPRAGHGPGIGGMKHDSEIGVALKAGHPCYFVGFLPDPVPGRQLRTSVRRRPLSCAGSRNGTPRRRASLASWGIARRVGKL